MNPIVIKSLPKKFTLSEKDLEKRIQKAEVWSKEHFETDEAKYLKLTVESSVKTYPKSFPDFTEEVMKLEGMKFRKEVFSLLFEDYVPEKTIEIPCQRCKKEILHTDGAMHKDCEQNMTEFISRNLVRCIVCDRECKGLGIDSNFDSLAIYKLKDYGIPKSVYLSHGSWVQFCDNKKCLRKLARLGRELSKFKEHISFFGGKIELFSSFAKSIKKDDCVCCKSKRNGFVMDINMFLESFRQYTYNPVLLLEFLSCCENCLEIRKENLPKDRLELFEHKFQVTEYFKLTQFGIGMLKVQCEYISKRCSTCAETLYSNSRIGVTCYGEKCKGLNRILGYDYEICRWCTSSDHIFKSDYISPCKSPVCLFCFSFNNRKKVRVFLKDREENGSDPEKLALFDRSAIKEEEMKSGTNTAHLIEGRTKKIRYIDPYEHIDIEKSKKSPTTENEFEQKNSRKNRKME